MERPLAFRSVAPAARGWAWPRAALARYRYPLAVFAASRALVYALIAALGWTHRTPGRVSYRTLVSPLGRWDASWYRWIAVHGYDRAGAHGHHANVMAFYPLFPLLYRAVSMLPGSAQVWGAVLSSALFAGALCALYRLTVNHLGEHLARRSVLYLAISPLAFVFAVPYSESLFLLLAVVSFVAAGAGRRWSAGGAAALATLARPVGIALAPALAWQIHRSRTGWRGYLPVLLPVAAEAGFFAYAAWHTGDVLAPIHAQERGWGRSVAVLPVLVAHVVWLVVARGANSAALVDVVFVVAWCGLAAQACRMRLPGEYLIFAALLVVLPASAGVLTSIGRFGTVAFPLFWALARLADTPRRDALVKAAFPLVMAGMMVAAYGSGSLHP
jgi:Mannosyltransferase (PIG-V)